MTIRNFAPRHVVATLIVAIGLLAACDSLPTEPTKGIESGSVRATPTPTFTPKVTPTPTPSPTPSPEPPFTQFLGAVINEDGAPLVGADVGINYIDFKGLEQWRNVSTITGGRYSMHVQARPNSQIYGQPGSLGLLYSWADGYDFNVQRVEGSASENQVDFRLRRPRQITAGGSILISIEPDSSLCTDLESYVDLKARCENLTIVASSAGTLTIEIAPATPGGAAPKILSPVTWQFVNGPVTMPVKAGWSVWTTIQIPNEAAPQQVVVSTSMQSTIR